MNSELGFDIVRAIGDWYLTIITLVVLISTG